MPQVFEVEGLGSLEFPDDATPEEITGFLNQQFPAGQASQRSTPPSIAAIEEVLTRPSGKPRLPNEHKEPLAQHAWETLNTSPVDIPSPEVTGVGTGIVAGLSDLAEGALTPLNLLTAGTMGLVGKVGKTVLGGVFGAPLIKATPEHLIEAANAPTAGEAARGYTQAAGGLAMAGGAIGATYRGTGRGALQFDPETNIARTEAGPIKVTPEGPRTLTETEIKSQEALGREVEPLPPKDPRRARAEESMAELDKQGEPVPTLAELEGRQVEQRAQLEQDFPTRDVEAEQLQEFLKAEGVKVDSQEPVVLRGKRFWQVTLDEGRGSTMYIPEYATLDEIKTQVTLKKEQMAQPVPTVEEQISAAQKAYLPKAAQKLGLETVEPDTYQRIEDEAILPDHVAFKDPKTNQLFQIPDDATQADLQELLGAVRGEEAAVRSRAELEARTQEVTSRGADEPPVTELPTSKPSGKYPEGFKPPDTKVRGEPISAWEGEVFRGESKSVGQLSTAGVYGKSAHGSGKYFGMTEADAQRFSVKDTVKKERVRLERPYVVRSDADVLAMRKAASEASGKPISDDWASLLDKQQGEALTEGLQKLGYDGVVVDYKEANGGRQVVQFQQKPVTSPDLNLWNSPERLQEWLKREAASGTFGKKGSPSGPTPRQAATKAAVEARVAELNGVREVATMALNRKSEGGALGSAGGSSGNLQKPRIQENKWGNWYGYLGNRKVKEFANTPEFTQEQAAQQWLKEQGDAMKPPSGEKGSVNLDLLADAGRTFYRKGMEFVEWSRNVLKGLGEKIKPYLSDLWKRMQSEEGAAGGSGGVQRKLTPKQQIQTTIMGKVPLTLANAVSKMEALKERLRGMAEGAKIGAKFGAAEQRKRVLAAEEILAENYKEVREELIEFSRSLPLAERAKFTNRIALALKPISSLYHNPDVIFDRAMKVADQITNAVYTVNRKVVIGKIEALLEKNEASKTINVPQKKLIRLKGEQFNRFKDSMSLDMLETMQERMQEIRSLGKDLYALDEVMKEQRAKATLREITTQGTRKVDAPEQLKMALGETEGWWAGQLRAMKQAPASALQRFNLALTPIDWMVQTFDGKLGGAIRRTMKLPIDIAYGEFLTERQPYKDTLRTLAKKHNLTAGNLDRITAHAELRQEGGLENLEAHGFSKKEINSVKTLSRGELEWLREADKILADTLPKIKAVSEGYFHHEVTDVKGYWPRQRDWSHYEALSIEEGRFGRSARNEPGFIQERTGAITYNRMNALEIMEKHIDDAMYHVKLGPEIARIAKVVRSKEFAENTGTAGQRFFSDWVDVLARNGGVESARRSKAIDILVRNTGLAQLALRVTTTGLQPLSIIQGMAVVSPKNMGKAITLMARKDYREFILNNFPEIKNRVGDDPAYSSYGGKGVKDTMARAGFYGISRLDRLSAMATGLGAYMDNLQKLGLPFDRNKVHLPSVQEAQLAVRKTQASALPKDVSLAQSRGNLTNSKSIDAALTQFQSFMIGKWALIKNGALQLGIKEKSVASGARIAGFILLGTIAEQMARDGVRRGGQAIFGKTDRNKQDDKKDKKERRTYEGKIAEKVGMDLVTSMPLVSNANGMIKYEGSGIPVVDVFTDTAAGLVRATTAAKPSTRTKGKIQVAQGALSLAGIPAGQIGDFAVQYVDANKPKKEKSR